MITIGGNVCERLGAAVTIDLETQESTIDCTLPSGSGVDVDILATIFASDLTYVSQPKPLVSYASPSITALDCLNCSNVDATSLKSCPRLGGSTLTYVLQIHIRVQY